MKRIDNIFSNLAIGDIEAAAYRAFRGHEGKPEVKRFKLKFGRNCKMLFECLKSKKWKRFIGYRQMELTSNGKRRKIDSPYLTTRIYQHLLLNLLEPIYNRRDNLNGLNCKKGCGITAKDKRKSVARRVKHLFYDLTELEYALVIDQRKCYEHVTMKVFRKALKGLTTDRELIDFAVDVCFIGKRFPIGTPSSPFGHHVLMLAFDRFAKKIAPFSVRYADDNLLAFRAKEEAQEAKWRVKNYWWYVLGMRAKRHTVKVQPLSVPLDFCGYVFHRNHKRVTEHNKGYVTVRRGTMKRAMKCRTDKSWASYFGLMKHADAYKLMAKIEQKMKLRELTKTIRIDRAMDAPHIDIRDLAGTTMTLYKYEMRYNSQKEANWIKCLVGVEEVTKDGELTGKMLAYEFHGNYQGIIQFLLAAEKEYGKSFLPLEEVEIENQCGYIFKESTNQFKYIE